MSDTVKIEVDGKTLEAKPGQMLIEVTDANNIYIPRFCYHPQLSIAANCRMCLVEVEKAPKPLPACATPVNEGMVVRTQSALALDSQKSVMEFLLINHPLDCPICDQGGECELQDLAMGYGRDVSRYQESKRVVQDKNIGPLVQTDMTRCIHCTRCVRFGEEIAGLRELGATGRGEHMEIGTYVEKSMRSELSGNVIDVCPVGALTSKPFRYSARAWEMRQGRSIAPHDCVGSNLEVHIKGNIVKRVVPGENADINEVWISDRDRYSYEGLYADDRLTEPMVKEAGEWKNVSWQQALSVAADGLKKIHQQHGAAQIGGLVSPSSTTEEAYLFSRMLRELGSSNIDHRVYQEDFSADHEMPSFPGLNLSINALEQQQAVVLIGSHLRYEQPMLNHRVRKAALQGASVFDINTSVCDFNYTHQSLIVEHDNLPAVLLTILERLDSDAAKAYASLATTTQNNLDDGVVNQLITALKENNDAIVLLGNQAHAHPQFSALASIASHICTRTGARLGFITPAANSSGCYLAGALPHRQAFAETHSSPGLNATQMLAQGLKAFLLMNLEPDHDLNAAANQALAQAEFNVAVTAYAASDLLATMDVLLPMALFAENEGSFINIEGQQQSFSQIVKPQGDIKPAWKIIRALMQELELSSTDINTLESIQQLITAGIGKTDLSMDGLQIQTFAKPENKPGQPGPIAHYSIDPMLRRATALQEREAAA